MKKPYFSMLGAIIFGLILMEGLMGLLTPSPIATNSSTVGGKFDGLLYLFLPIYFVLFFSPFLWFVWRILRYYTWLDRSRNKQEHDDR